jgi:putative membrane protein
VLDLGLAIAHHIAVFGLVALLAMEGLALKDGVVDPVRLAKIDGAYGLVAGLVIAIGVCRVIWGGKGWAYYAENPFFWSKMGLFLAIGLLSIGPTLLILRWRKAAAGAAPFTPPAAELKRARQWVGLEAVLLVPLLACAAAMARYPF